MRNLIQLTDAQIDEIFEDEFNRQDACEFYLSYTAETIENFLEARKNWQEWGTLSEGFTDIGGYRYITVDRCQALRGQTRCDIIVVDLGSARAIYQS
jgi:hypothetical protein